MRAAFVVAVVLGLLVGVLVAGARVVSDDDGGGAQAEPEASPTQTEAPEQGTPLEAVDRFARGWTDGDFDRMYLQLSAATQRDWPLDDFVAEYASFADEVTQRSVVATVTEAGETGATVAVRLETGYFGEMEYSIRLNLSRTEGAWRIDWDRTVIHPELAGGRVFKSTIERPKRGAIVDRDGEMLAFTEDVRMLGLNRAVMDDPIVVAAALVNFGFPQADVDAAFASGIPQNQRVPVGRVPDERLEEAVTTLGSMPGVLLYFETRRVHPLGANAAHVVGYTRELTAEDLEARKGQGYRAGDRIGATGLEAELEERLAGKVGAELRLVEPDEVTTARVVASQVFAQGEDITTTLDGDVLAAVQARLGARSGAAVVMDPSTNAIIAINSSPTFDPDAFERGDSAALEAINNSGGSPLTDRATIGLYSAGSTFKLITGSAGLADGGYSTSSTIFCGATWDGLETEEPRKNWEGAQGPLTIAGGLMRSCNPVFYEIGLTLYENTDEALSKWSRLYGFGASTGTVGLFDEAGLVPDSEWKQRERGEAWYPGDEVNLAIGQGDLLMTPLQLANAYVTFANRELRTPVILAGVAPEPRGALPLTDDQWNHLLYGLQLVTGPGGTANTTFAGYSGFAGKSGTAEDTGAQQHVLFVAFAPSTAPTALAAVVLDDGQSGSTEAGPIARDAVLAALDQ